MDRINDPPRSDSGSLADDDPVVPDGPHEDLATRAEKDQVPGSGVILAGSAPIDAPRMPHTATKPSAPDPSEAQISPDDGVRITGWLDPDADDDESVHTDTGSGSNNLTGAAST